MDLSFPRPEPAGDVPLPAADMVVLAAALSTRQAGSVTARAQAAIDRPAADGGDAPAPELLLAPAGGAFSAAMAARLAGWSEA